MEVTALDGRAYAKFLTAGTYFLRKYRGVLNDLNVFPVPDGDTGTNMYLTVRQALLAAGKVRSRNLSVVAASAAEGSLMGARGNSGVIISQMLRGFAHHVRHRSEIDTFLLATAMREAVHAAKQALVKPVAGTIISVAEAAAEAAYRIALHERDFYRLANGVLRVANEALDKTPEQLPALREAGVVDSGGAGFVYFLEGILRFLPDVHARATAFPRRPVRKSVFTPSQVVGENRFCTEFVLERAAVSVSELRDALLERGDSLIVAGGPPTLKVHIHTDDPDGVQSAAAKHGQLTRIKVDNMERQHNLLVIDRPAVTRSAVAVVAGPGFERIAKELGAEATVSAEQNPSVRNLLLAVNKCLGNTVYVFANDANVILAAGEAAALAERDVRVVGTRDPVGGIAGLLALAAVPADELIDAQQLEAAGTRGVAVSVFFAGKDATIGGTTVQRGNAAARRGEQLYTASSLATCAASALADAGASEGGLITLYYGGAQRERDAQRAAEDLRRAFPSTDVEYYYGGQRAVEYWISYDE